MLLLIQSIRTDSIHIVEISLWYTVEMSLQYKHISKNKLGLSAQCMAFQVLYKHRNCPSVCLVVPVIYGSQKIVVSKTLRQDLTVPLQPKITDTSFLNAKQRKL